MTKKHKQYVVSFFIGIAVFIIAIAFMETAALAQEYPEGMVSYWRFEEGYGNIAYDSVNGNNATIYGANWTSGRVGNALSFDGNDYVNCGNPDNLKIYPPLSVEVWINPSVIDPNASTGKIILSKGDQAFRYYSMWITPWGTLGFNVEATYNNQIQTEELLDPNEWYHVVGVHDGEQIYIYVNGELKNHADSPLKPYQNNSNAPMTIGIEPSYMWDPNRWFKGVIDEVAIYNRALTQEEIWQHYQSGLYVGVPFGDLTFSKVDIMFKHALNNDNFGLSGEFVLSDTSDGIDPVNEYVVIEAGSSTIMIPAGSFIEKEPGKFEFLGTVDGADVKMNIKAVDVNTFKFKAKADGVDLTGMANPTNISLIIGNDYGSDEVRLKGKLDFNGSKAK